MIFVDFEFSRIPPKDKVSFGKERLLEQSDLFYQLFKVTRSLIQSDSQSERFVAHIPIQVAQIDLPHVEVLLHTNQVKLHAHMTNRLFQIELVFAKKGNLFAWDWNGSRFLPPMLH